MPTTVEVFPISDQLINSTRNRLVDINPGFEYELRPDNEVSKTVLVYLLYLYSREFALFTLHATDASSFEDKVFQNAFELALQDVTAITWMHYHPICKNFFRARKSALEAGQLILDSDNTKIDKAINAYITTFDRIYTIPIAKFINEHVIGQSKAIANIQGLKRTWNSSLGHTADEPTLNTTVDHAYDELKQALLKQYKLCIERGAPYDKLAALAVENRLSYSPVYTLSNGLPFFSFVAPHGILHPSKSERLSYDDTDIMKSHFTDAKNHPFMETFNGITFANPEDLRPVTEKENEASAEHSSNESDNESPIKGDEFRHDEPTPTPVEGSEPQVLHEPLPPHQSADEMETTTSSDSNQGTGRYNRRLKLKQRAEKSDSATKATSLHPKSADMAATTYNGLICTQDDIEEHHLTDLLDKAREYIDSLNEPTRPPTSQNHFKRFDVEDDAPQELHSVELEDDDIIVNLNDSLRSVRYVLTFVSTYDQPVFNRIIDPRRNRKS